jgi:hypothetical protein
MSNTNKNDRAFPSHGSMGEVAYEDMTLRQYAAIKLKVPESGTPWLDDMIRKSLCNDLAAKAMHANRTRKGSYETWDDLAIDAYQIADAVMRCGDESE